MATSRQEGKNSCRFAGTCVKRETRGIRGDMEIDYCSDCLTGADLRATRLKVALLVNFTDGRADFRRNRGFISPQSPRIPLSPFSLLLSSCSTAPARRSCGRRPGRICGTTPRRSGNDPSSLRDAHTHHRRRGTWRRMPPAEDAVPPRPARSDARTGGLSPRRCRSSRRSDGCTPPCPSRCSPPGMHRRTWRRSPRTHSTLPRMRVRRRHRSAREPDDCRAWIRAAALFPQEAEKGRAGSPMQPFCRSAYREPRSHGPHSAYVDPARSR